MFDALRSKPATIVSREKALPDRTTPITVAERHAVLNAPLRAPFGEGIEQAVFGLGCFWGAERIFWQLDGVVSTAVGYAGGHTAHATYQDVCSGASGHTEVVLVAFDPDRISYEQLLRRFFESHDPTQGMRQGNDRGTQYRSAIYTHSEQQATQAQAAAKAYAEALKAAGHKASITTEIGAAGPFYYAEDYHQQYLAKNPNGYCGIGGTGVSCPVGLTPAE
ncbi:MAG: peptide-methionine (S)-S-oxide reductase MsrA [Gammaproteobacteria bacterium]